MVLLHAYSSDPAYADRQAETWAALASIEPELLGRGWTVEHVATPPDGTYERTVGRLWGEDDLIVCEHDIVPTLDMLLALAACPHPLCAQAYRLHYLQGGNGAMAWIKSKLPELDEESRERLRRANMTFFLDSPDAWFDRGRGRHVRGNCWEPFCHRVIESDGLCRWGEEGDEWADLAGLGLTKISREFQRTHAPGWKPGTWGDLDGRISVWVHEGGLGRWHVHWPEVPHNHPCATAMWVGDASGFAAIHQPEESEILALRSSLPPANQIPAELDALAALVRELRPTTVLEVGVESGGTLARWALESDPGALLVGVDVRVPPSVPHRASQSLRLVEGDSHDPETARRVRSALRGRPVDFLFIDGDHFGAVRDFEDYAPLIRPGGIVAFHDIHPGPAANVGTVPDDWRRIREGRRHREIVAFPGEQAGYGIGVLFIEAAAGPAAKEA